MKAAGVLAAAAGLLAALALVQLASAAWLLPHHNEGAVSSAPLVDTDGDGDPDWTDACPQTATTWLTPAGDDDCDGFATAIELNAGTDPDLACGPAAWPPDLDDNRLVNIVDILEVAPHLAQTGPNMRHDLNADFLVNIVDILEIAPFLTATC